MTLADPNYRKNIELMKQMESTVHTQKKQPFDGKKFRESLPSEMFKEKRFVRYFLKPKPDGQGTAKIPLGNHSDPTTWSYFDEAVNNIENEGQGIGYSFLGGDIHGLDLD